MKQLPDLAGMDLFENQKKVSLTLGRLGHEFECLDQLTSTGWILIPYVFLAREYKCKVQLSQQHVKLQ